MKWFAALVAISTLHSSFRRLELRICDYTDSFGVSVVGGLATDILVLVVVGNKETIGISAGAIPFVWLGIRL